MEADHPELKEPEEKAEEIEPAAEKQPEVEDKAEDKEQEETKPVEVVEVDKSVQDWADKHQLTVEQAKEDLEKTKAVVGKYKSPEEMARALRLIQSEHDKLKNETSKQEHPVITPAVQVDPRVEINQYVSKNAENLLAEYKRVYPAKSEVLTEEAILEDIADRYYGRYQTWANDQLSVIKQNASNKREEALNSLSQEDKQFLPEIKPVLQSMSNDQVLSKEFDIKELIAWAKGKNIDKLIKEAEERGYKRAKGEGSKIIAQIPQGRSESKSINKKPSGTISLSNHQKDRALEMFDGTSMTDDEKFQAFAELEQKKAEKKK